jgi:hypothetical protein
MNIEFGCSQKMLSVLKDLKKNYGLKGIKAEFEAEGSNLNDINRLSRLTSKLNIGLYVKIGGVEALRDIYDCYECGVNGIIAPMVETKFAAKKFIDSIKKIPFKKRPFLTINIETIHGFRNLESILRFIYKDLKSITIGRSDLVSSLFNKKINVDSPQILNLIKKVCYIAKNYGIDVNVGGGVSKKTFEVFKNDPFLGKNIKCIETRKVIFKTYKVLKKKNAIEKAMEFEKLYILSKKEYSDLRISSELLRLSKLKERS